MLFPTFWKGPDGNRSITRAQERRWFGVGTAPLARPPKENHHFGRMGGDGLEGQDRHGGHQRFIVTVLALATSAS